MQNSFWFAVICLTMTVFLAGCSHIQKNTDQDPKFVGGIFSLGPVAEGLQEIELTPNGTCPNDLPVIQSAGNRGLCHTGNLYQTMESTWENPNISGVYIRLPWASTHIAPGSDPSSFNFAALDRELNQAVKHGKYVSLSFSAGKNDTPNWIFTQDSVEPLMFRDGAPNLEAGKCGSTMTLGNPTDQAYQQQYFDLIRGVGEHIRSNPEWYDALAYFKISGANMFTNEIMLPRRCQEDCPICNTEVWAKAGYTPEGFKDFMLKQMAVIQEAFPGKPMAYQLIQDGLPWMNNAGDYLQADGNSSGSELISSVDQVEEIIRSGSETWGSLFVIAHNGVRFDHKPNNWVLRAEKSGQPTIWQTSNLSHITNLQELQLTLENFWKHTQSPYLEVYEELLWTARASNGQLIPNDQADINSIQEWNEQLKSRE